MSEIKFTQSDFEELVVNDTEQAVDRIEGLLDLEGQDNLEYLSARIKKTDAIPIIYANHLSFLDGLVLSRLTRLVIEDARKKRYSEGEISFRGFRLPASVTGRSLPLHDALTPIYESRGLYLVGVYTDEEKKQLETEGKSVSREVTNTLLDAPKEGFGLAIFPETSPGGGIERDDGSIVGIQRVVRKDFVKYLNRYQRIYPDRNVVFLPVGINGTHRLLPPDTNTPTQEVIDAVCDTYGPSISLGKITVGNLVEAKELDKAIDANAYLMSVVAELLPDEARGYYR